MVSDVIPETEGSAARSCHEQEWEMMDVPAPEEENPPVLSILVLF